MVLIGVSFPISKINTQTQVLSGPAVPPLCEAHHQIDTWELGAVPKGSSEFKKQFISINNVKPITNWYGFERVDDCRLRYFFDTTYGAWHAPCDLLPHKCGVLDHPQS